MVEGLWGEKLEKGGSANCSWEVVDLLMVDGSWRTFHELERCRM
jgi:hypothetical protein